MFKTLHKIRRWEADNHDDILNEEVITTKYFLGIKYSTEHSTILYELKPEDEKKGKHMGFNNVKKGY